MKVLGIPRSTAPSRLSVPRPLTIQWPRHPNIPLLDLTFAAADRISAADTTGVVLTEEAVLLALDAATENGIAKTDLAERAGHLPASHVASVQSTVDSIAEAPESSSSESEHVRTEPAQRAGHKRERCEIEDEEDEEPEEPEGDERPLSENAQTVVQLFNAMERMEQRSSQ